MNMTEANAAQAASGSRGRWYSRELSEVWTEGGYFRALADGCLALGKVYFEEGRDGRRRKKVYVHSYSDERRQQRYDRNQPLSLTIVGDDGSEEVREINEKIYLSFHRIAGRSKNPEYYPERERLVKKYGEPIADAVIDLITEIEMVFSGALVSSFEGERHRRGADSRRRHARH